MGKISEHVRAVLGDGTRETIAAHLYGKDPTDEEELIENVTKEVYRSERHSILVYNHLDELQDTDIVDAEDGKYSLTEQGEEAYRELVKTSISGTEGSGTVINLLNGGA